MLKTIKFHTLIIMFLLLVTATTFTIFAIKTKPPELLMPGYAIAIPPVPIINSDQAIEKTESASGEFKINVVDEETLGLLPKNSNLGKRIDLDLNKDGSKEIILSYYYNAPFEANHMDANSGVLVYKKTKNILSKIYDMPTYTGNGDGVWGAPKIEITGENGDHPALLVVNETSGAGTWTGWDILTMKNGVVSIIPSSLARKIIFDKYKYEDMGYNNVRLDKETGYIIERIPGYSFESARCCPDKPAIEATYSFDGEKIFIVSIKEIPISE